MALRAAAKERQSPPPLLGYVYVFDKHSHYSILRLFHRQEYTEKARNTKGLHKHINHYRKLKENETQITK